MDHSTHTPLSAPELNDENLIGATIYGMDDEKVGSISHLHHTGTTVQAVVDVGGFLGIGARPVLVSLSELNIMRDAHGNIHGQTAWTKDQLKALPEHHD